MPEWPYIAETTDFPDIPPNYYIEPIRIAAGDAILFYRTLSLYPSSAGWSLTYSLRGNGLSKIDFTSTPFGNDHQVNIAASITALWLPGEYTAQGYATLAATGERHMIFEGLITILPNLNQQTPDTDPRTHAKRTLDNIELVLEGRATDDILDTEIAGTTIRRLPIDQLLKLRNYYKAEVKGQVDRAKILGGRATGRKILAKFATPT